MKKQSKTFFFLNICILSLPHFITDFKNLGPWRQPASIFVGSTYSPKQDVCRGNAAPHAFFFQNVFFFLQVYFFQAELELCCFKSLSLVLSVPSSLGWEAVRRNVEPGLPGRAVQRAHSLIRASAASLQEADIWWVSFRKVIINTVFLLCRRFWPLLAYSCPPKAKIMNPCCCRGLTPAPTHKDTCTRFLLHNSLALMSPGAERGIFGEFSRCFTWSGMKGTPLSTAMQDAPSPPQPPEELSSAPRVVVCLLGHQQMRTMGFQFCWKFVSLLALLRRC